MVTSPSMKNSAIHLRALKTLTVAFFKKLLITHKFKFNHTNSRARKLIPIFPNPHQSQ